MAVLDTLNCRRVGEEFWLASDLTVPCPLFNEGGFVFVWTVFAMVGYPFGIPLAMLLSLRRFGVQRMARREPSGKELNFRHCAQAIGSCFSIRSASNSALGFELTSDTA